MVIEPVLAKWISVEALGFDPFMAKVEMRAPLGLRSGFGVSVVF